MKRSFPSELVYQVFSLLIAFIVVQVLHVFQQMNGYIGLGDNRTVDADDRLGDVRIEQAALLFAGDAAQKRAVLADRLCGRIPGNFFGGWIPVDDLHGVVDDKQAIKMVNRHLVEAFGVTADEGIGRCVGEVLGCSTALEDPGRCGCADGCDGCPIHVAVVDALAGQQVEKRRCRFASVESQRSRERTILVSSSAITHRGERLAILIIEDITEQLQEVGQDMNRIAARMS